MLKFSSSQLSKSSVHSKTTQDPIVIKCVAFIYYQVPSFEIQADIFMGLRVKYGNTSKNIS